MIGRRTWLAWVLVVSLVVQPLVYEGALWAQETGGTASDMGTAVSEVDKGDQQVQGMKEIKLSWWQKLVVKAAGKYGKIKEANKAIKEAKAQSSEATALTKTTQGTHSSASSAGAGLHGSVERTANAKAILQESMIKVGEKLQKIAEMISQISVALIAAGTATTALFGVGTILVTVGTVLKGVAGALTKAGASIASAGKAGKTDDKAFFKALGEGAKGFASGYKEGKALGNSATAGVQAVLADNKDAGWYDRFKGALTGTGEDGKKILKTVEKGEKTFGKVADVAGKIWTKTKDVAGEVWGAAKGIFGGDDEVAPAAGASAAAPTTAEGQVTTTGPETGEVLSGAAISEGVEVITNPAGEPQTPGRANAGFLNDETP